MTGCDWTCKPNKPFPHQVDFAHGVYHSNRNQIKAVSFAWLPPTFTVTPQSGNKNFVLIFIGLTLYKSCAGNSTCCELVCATSMTCPALLPIHQLSHSSHPLLWDVPWTLDWGGWNRWHADRWIITSILGILTVIILWISHYALEKRNFSDQSWEQHNSMSMNINI